MFDEKSLTLPANAPALVDGFYRGYRDDKSQDVVVSLDIREFSLSLMC